MHLNLNFPVPGKCERMNFGEFVIVGAQTLLESNSESGKGLQPTSFEFETDSSSSGPNLGLAHGFDSDKCDVYLPNHDGKYNDVFVGDGGHGGVCFSTYDISTATCDKLET
ncbi:hypothetical protein C1H46_002141 [Malus baccata]|uniref:Uncharacterized protein n=1 Tax=Malus baccata TaxID=106549 RepID=A0A540NMG8_MALBA|nr:hypothetical protein C1H46_002141 [Malus baccata]